MQCDVLEKRKTITSHCPLWGLWGYSSLFVITYSCSYHLPMHGWQSQSVWTMHGWQSGCAGLAESDCTAGRVSGGVASGTPVCAGVAQACAGSGTNSGKAPPGRSFGCRGSGVTPESIRHQSMPARFRALVARSSSCSRLAFITSSPQFRRSFIIDRRR